MQIAPHVLWNQGYTMHTQMSMLEEWQQTKMSIGTLTTLTFPILETLNLFKFWLHIYAIHYLDSCFDHFITLFVL